MRRDANGAGAVASATAAQQKQTTTTHTTHTTHLGVAVVVSKQKLDITTATRNKETVPSCLRHNAKSQQSTHWRCGDTKEGFSVAAAVDDTAAAAGEEE